MRNYEAHNDAIRQQMLEEIGVGSVEELFKKIPAKCKLNGLNIGNPLSELEALKKVTKLSEKNEISDLCFLGGGAYKRFIPSAVSAVASRFEFLSAYTPYQPEISQGTLQVIYEFQTMMCNLTNMEVSNASVYDGATALAEGILMAIRISKVNSAFISNNINPNYVEVVKTYLWAHNIDFVIGDKIPEDKEFGAIAFQFPNYLGELEETPERKGKALLVASVDLFALANLEPPKADIITGDIQTLGLPLNYGGPYGGFITTLDKYKRQLPGRIVGKSVDKNGSEAYVLTLQAREQHIRREKATGNICSNQALCALMSTVYVSLMGKTGLKEASLISYKNAHKLAEGLKKKGYKILNKDFYFEFVLEVENADKFLKAMKNKGIQAGIKLCNNKILVATSEYLNDEEIEQYINSVE